MIDNPFTTSSPQLRQRWQPICHSTGIALLLISLVGCAAPSAITTNDPPKRNAASSNSQSTATGLESTTVPNTAGPLAPIAASPKPTTEPTYQFRRSLDDLYLKADNGDIDAQYQLGVQLSSPETNGHDPQGAINWLQRAGEQGDSRALFFLGDLYYHGRGVDRSYHTSREYWLEAAVQGNDQAQLKLGYMYSEGLGVPIDYERAKRWYLKAAALGNAEAQTLLGSLFHEGNRIPPDYTQAFKWYELAAKQGHPHSQYILGTLYHDGLGTQIDDIKCLAWVDVALKNGYDDHLGARQECRKHLAPQAIAQATSLSNKLYAAFSQRKAESETASRDFQ